MHNLKFEGYVSCGDLTKDYNPGYSLPDNSEELFQRCKEEPRYRGIFAENKNTKAHVIKQKITTNHKSQASQVNVFVLFYVWEDTRAGVVEIIPMMCILTF